MGVARKETAQRFSPRGRPNSLASAGNDRNLTAAVPYPMRKPVGIGYPASFGLGATGRRRSGDAMEGRS